MVIGTGGGAEPSEPMSCELRARELAAPVFRSSLAASPPPVAALFLPHHVTAWHCQQPEPAAHSSLAEDNAIRKSINLQCTCVSPSLSETPTEAVRPSLPAPARSCSCSVTSVDDDQYAVRRPAPPSAAPHGTTPLTPARRHLAPHLRCSAAPPDDPAQRRPAPMARRRVAPTSAALPDAVPGSRGPAPPPGAGCPEPPTMPSPPTPVQQEALFGRLVDLRRDEAPCTGALHSPPPPPSQFLYVVSFGRLSQSRTTNRKMRRQMLNC
ncbi:hypothetical protein ABZP36_005200 [Zizania latifolia]